MGQNDTPYINAEQASVSSELISVADVYSQSICRTHHSRCATDVLDAASKICLTCSPYMQLHMTAQVQSESSSESTGDEKRCTVGVLEENNLPSSELQGATKTMAVDVQGIENTQYALVKSETTPEAKSEAEVKVNTKAQTAFKSEVDIKVQTAFKSEAKSKVDTIAKLEGRAASLANQKALAYSLSASHIKANLTQQQDESAKLDKCYVEDFRINSLIEEQKAISRLFTIFKSYRPLHLLPDREYYSTLHSHVLFTEPKQIQALMDDSEHSMVLGDAAFLVDLKTKQYSLQVSEHSSVQSSGLAHLKASEQSGVFEQWPSLSSRLIQYAKRHEADEELTSRKPTSRALAKSTSSKSKYNLNRRAINQDATYAFQNHLEIGKGQNQHRVGQTQQPLNHYSHVKQFEEEWQEQDFKLYFSSVLQSQAEQRSLVLFTGKSARMQKSLFPKLLACKESSPKTKLNSNCSKNFGQLCKLEQQYVGQVSRSGRRLKEYSIMDIVPMYTGRWQLTSSSAQSSNYPSGYNNPMLSSTEGNYQESMEYPVVPNKGSNYPHNSNEQSSHEVCRHKTLSVLSAKEAAIMPANQIADEVLSLQRSCVLINTAPLSKQKLRSSKRQRNLEKEQIERFVSHLATEQSMQPLLVLDEDDVLNQQFTENDAPLAITADFDLPKEHAVPESFDSLVSSSRKSTTHTTSELVVHVSLDSAVQTPCEQTALESSQDASHTQESAQSSWDSVQQTSLGHFKVDLLNPAMDETTLSLSKYKSDLALSRNKSTPRLSMDSAKESYFDLTKERATQDSCATIISSVESCNASLEQHHQEVSLSMQPMLQAKTVLEQSVKEQPAIEQYKKATVNIGEHEYIFANQQGTSTESKWQLQGSGKLELKTLPLLENASVQCLENCMFELHDLPLLRAQGKNFLAENSKQWVLNTALAQHGHFRPHHMRPNLSYLSLDGRERTEVIPLEGTEWTQVSPMSYELDSASDKTDETKSGDRGCHKSENPLDNTFVFSPEKFTTSSFSSRTLFSSRSLTVDDNSLYVSSQDAIASGTASLHTAGLDSKQPIELHAQHILPAYTSTDSHQQLRTIHQEGLLYEGYALFSYDEHTGFKSHQSANQLKIRVMYESALAYKDIVVAQYQQNNYWLPKFEFKNLKSFNELLHSQSSQIPGFDPLTIPVFENSSNTTQQSVVNKQYAACAIQAVAFATKEDTHLLSYDDRQSLRGNSFMHRATLESLLLSAPEEQIQLLSIEEHALVSQVANNLQQSQVSCASHTSNTTHTSGIIHTCYAEDSLKTTLSKVDDELHPIHSASDLVPSTALDVTPSSTSKLVQCNVPETVVSETSQATSESTSESVASVAKAVSISALDIVNTIAAQSVLENPQLEANLPVMDYVLDLATLAGPLQSTVNGRSKVVKVLNGLWSQLVYSARWSGYSLADSNQHPQLFSEVYELPELVDSNSAISSSNYVHAASLIERNTTSCDGDSSSDMHQMANQSTNQTNQTDKCITTQSTNQTNQTGIVLRNTEYLNKDTQNSDLQANAEVHKASHHTISSRNLKSKLSILDAATKVGIWVGFTKPIEQSSSQPKVLLQPKTKSNDQPNPQQQSIEQREQSDLKIIQSKAQVALQDLNVEQYSVQKEHTPFNVTTIMNDEQPKLVFSQLAQELSLSHETPLSPSSSISLESSVALPAVSQLLLPQVASQPLLPQVSQAVLHQLLQPQSESHPQRLTSDRTVAQTAAALGAGAAYDELERLYNHIMLDEMMLDEKSQSIWELPWVKVVEGVDHESLQAYEFSKAQAVLSNNTHTKTQSCVGKERPVVSKPANINSLKKSSSKKPTLHFRQLGFTVTFDHYASEVCCLPTAFAQYSLNCLKYQDISILLTQERLQNASVISSVISAQGKDNPSSRYLMQHFEHTEVMHLGDNLVCCSSLQELCANYSTLFGLQALTLQEQIEHRYELAVAHEITPNLLTPADSTRTQAYLSHSSQEPMSLAIHSSSSYV